MRDIEEHTEEREGGAANEVLETPTFEPLDGGHEHLDGWLQAVHAQGTRTDRGRAAVDELVPRHRGEGRVQQRREAEREREHTGEEAEVEVAGQNGVAG